ncbi:hypothetical protein Moror_11763 [Moniliophthora roreri MCA 2997]|uniref:G-protein coupled receptors family 2 profile 2 domain-containing protein n=2 Tax=Moniliophthora roreri TaxID=221103 RepID=V2WR35_MONRO|nr:hypothetical protein Moror_11763 [Moniliophthora roreri MCA 2997]KAI3605847.1 hypothetical protein WG66_012365 [Moniliophthora roreri]
MDFKFTPEVIAVSNKLWAITSAVGAGLCFLVLLVISLVSIHPKSRAQLDRVSFRILVYALLANMIFGMAGAIGGTRTGPGFICGFSVFVLQFTLQSSSFLLFCIALNLHLVIVHDVNGQRMEKYYIIVSALVAITLVVPPYAAGQYGWDHLAQDCWYTNADQTQRLIWQVTTQIGWTMLTVIGDVICSGVVLMSIVKHNIRTRKVFASTHSFSQVSSAPQVLHANNYKFIILRVALYPLTSCCVNLLSIVTVVHTTISHGIHNRTDYDMLLLSDFLFGGRAIVYALLAASDPALVRAVRVLFSQFFYRAGRATSSVGNPGSSCQVTEVFVELSIVKSAAAPPESTIGANDKAANHSPVAPPDDKKMDNHTDRNADVEFAAGPLEVPDFAVEHGERLHATGVQLRRQRIEAQWKEQEGQKAFKKQI